MLIQIDGGGFDNRGAQLMLWAVVERLGRLLPDAAFAMEAHRSTYRQRASYGVMALCPRAPFHRPNYTKRLLGLLDLGSRLLPRSLEASYGVARRCDVDAYVDISGYALGDKWSLAMQQAAAARVQRMRRRGVPVVFLPQMFGPFENPSKRGPIEQILRQATKVYAREQRSLEILKAVDPAATAIAKAPDITIFTEPRPAGFSVDGPYACLVPNLRVIDKAADSWGPDYIAALAAAAERLQSHGVAPYVVIHDSGKDDLKPAEQVLEKAGLPRERLYFEDDPLRIKGFFQGAVMTVGSRFHALVSCLSVGTPSIAIGWAHKYEELMSDFGVPDYCCKHADGVAGVLGKIDHLADASQRAAITETLKQHKAAMKPENDRMWGDVAAALRG